MSPYFPFDGSIWISNAKEVTGIALKSNAMSWHFGEELNLEPYVRGLTHVYLRMYMRH
jgi:hypothetical protein